MNKLSQFWSSICCNPWHAFSDHEGNHQPSWYCLLFNLSFMNCRNSFLKLSKLASIIMNELHAACDKNKITFICSEFITIHFMIKGHTVHSPWKEFRASSELIPYMFLALWNVVVSLCWVTPFVHESLESIEPNKISFRFSSRCNFCPMPSGKHW